MAFKSLTDSLHNVVDRLEDYGLSLAEYYKLRIFKSVMKGSISLVNLLVYGSLSLFVMLFLSIGAALWVGSLLGNSYGGFFIVGGFYAIILIFMFVVGRKIIAKKMIYSASSLLYDEDDLDPKYVAEKEIEEYENVLKEEALRKDNL